MTGVIRNATTFVGKVLSLPLEVDYIHKPFNPKCGIPGIKGWYRYVDPNISTKEMRQYHQLTKSIFSYDFILKGHYPESDPLLKKSLKKIIGSREPFYLRLAKPNIFHNAVIIKDPTRNLLSEYLYTHFSVKPVIVIKHPISFITSLKRVNWWPNLQDIGDRSRLSENYFYNEPNFLEGKYNSPVMAAAAYWRATYKVILAQASRHPDWQVFTHEELSQAPISVFKNLYTNLDLPWSKTIENKILKLTTNNSSATAR